MFVKKKRLDGLMVRIYSFEYPRQAESFAEFSGGIARAGRDMLLDWVVLIYV